ncbi:MAG: ATP-binding protein [Desulfobacterales bacterium]|nr:ATP-binding protein [Desulfobacterales bacterium]
MGGKDPMKANPGGTIDPKEVVGRDELIKKLWRVLDRQSIVLSAERRMGKTCVLQKMTAEATEDKLAVFHDLEQVSTPLEFVKIVFNDVEKYLSTQKQIAHRARKVLEHLRGAEFKGFKIPKAADPYWKEFLIETIKDLKEHQDRKVIFFWDEVPMMLQKIERDTSEDVAMDLLDTLRAIRQMNDGLRMVFTGSIGLHNVITSLKHKGYINEPINDMFIQDLPPLSQDDAQYLALRLIEGESINTKDPSALSRKIAAAANNIPYYIQHVVDKAVMENREIDDPVIDKIILGGLTHPLDSWDMRHYRERMDTYYTDEEKPFALAILDALTGVEESLPFNDLFNLLKAQIESEDEEKIRHVIKLLLQDHYIVMNTDGTYQFKFGLIKRWWQLDRGVDL